MAALFKHGAFKFPPKAVWGVRFVTGERGKIRRTVDKKRPPKIEAAAQSIEAKGFLRAVKSYTPPENLEDKLNSIAVNLLGNDTKTHISLEQKFALFTACAEEFDHSVPNSILHTINTVEELQEFYQTPVSNSTPLDKMRHMELPENLHVQFEYHRFHPETDSKFGGQTAFNRSSTVVSGLKYKDKYKGHVQNQTWPFNS